MSGGYHEMEDDATVGVPLQAKNNTITASEDLQNITGDKY